MSRNPVVLIHGYSDKGRSFDRWVEVLREAGIPAEGVHLGNYVSLANEVTIKDVAEGFDRALHDLDGLDPEQHFDAMVHSTGMLVIRAWLASQVSGDDRARRLKRLIALAPATFGSPLAHKGRSFLGAVFKGGKTPGPDFMEAGDRVLDALELGSRFTWDLAHRDLLGEHPLFDDGPDTPYVFTFCGDQGYGGIKKAINPIGSDGTVRWAGCALNTRKIEIDLMVGPGKAPLQGARPSRISEWGNVNIPLLPVANLNHATILKEPTRELIDLVVTALRVDSRDGHEAWLREAKHRTDPTRVGMTRWQQFVIRVVDERGDPVPDWNMQLFRKARGRRSLEEFDLDVHKYEGDKSLRCFHVDLDRLDYERLDELHLKLIATSGSQLVAYHGVGSERVSADGRRTNPRAKWDAQLDLTPLVKDRNVKLFFPFTTTLIQMKLNREPMPMVGRNKVFWFS